MNRAAEAALLVGAATLAAMGTALVNLARGGSADAQVALTFLVFLIAFGAIHLSVRQWAPSASPYLLPLGALLTALGFVTIYRLDGALASRQRWWVLIGAGAAVVTLWMLRRQGTAVLRRYRYLFLLLALILLLMPLLPSTWPVRGVEVNGSRLWVRLVVAGREILQFQPGEIAKLLLVVFLASYLAERQPALAGMQRKIGPIDIPEPRQLVPVLAAWAASFLVLVYQRDLGASMLLFAVFLTMLFVASGRGSYLLAGGALFGAGAVVALRVFDHAQRRVEAWLHPWNDFAGNGYQIIQGLFAMGSGSLTGSGLGLGRPDLIPSASTDFVFAAVGEEMGVAGSLAVVAAYALLVGAAFGIAVRARDSFRKLLAAGLAITLAVQSILIIGGVVRLLPLTGIALPFMSYGGSALIANLIALALLARVSDEERS